MQSFFLGSGQAFKGCLQFCLGQHQLLHALSADAIKALRVLQHGEIAPLLNISQNFSNTRFNGRISVCRPMQTFLKRGFKICIGRFQTQCFGN